MCSTAKYYALAILLVKKMSHVVLYACNTVQFCAKSIITTCNMVVQYMKAVDSSLFFLENFPN